MRQKYRNAWAKLFSLYLFLRAFKKDNKLMVRIGVLGTGHLGKIHLKLIREIKDFDLVGFFDPNDDHATQAENEFGLKRFYDLDALLDEIDAVDIVTNTISHYECAVKALRKSKHIFVEKPLANTLEEAREMIGLADSGIKEIVLTGVNIGDFGITDASKGTRDESFFELLQCLDEITGIERFRISSIEPNLLKDEIIEFVAASKLFMPHFHIPLQSGSDNILKLMKRRYLSQHYAERIGLIKSLMPHCCIGADVIVGFPGESDEEFLKTYDFLCAIDVSYLHVFTYSERDETEASTMKNVVPKGVRHERNKMLRILSEKKRETFYQSQIGKNSACVAAPDDWRHHHHSRCERTAGSEDL
jgi:MiaB/RimO family radical SAM methylthiotransferase